MRLTADDLRTLYACSDQVEDFERMWPNGCKVGVHNLRRALKAGLDVLWWVRNDSRCTPVLIKCKEVCDTAWDKYAAKMLQAKHEKMHEKMRIKIRAAWDEYEKTCDAALVAAIDYVERKEDL